MVVLWSHKVERCHYSKIRSSHLWTPSWDLITIALLVIRPYLSWEKEKLNDSGSCSQISPVCKSPIHRVQNMAHPMAPKKNHVYNCFLSLDRRLWYCHSNSRFLTSITIYYSKFFPINGGGRPVYIVMPVTFSNATQVSKDFTSKFKVQLTPKLFFAYINLFVSFITAAKKLSL